jgi:hypothetical protein
MKWMPQVRCLVSQVGLEQTRGGGAGSLKLARVARN